jgi:hypothetical protein
MSASEKGPKLPERVRPWAQSGWRGCPCRSSASASVSEGTRVAGIPKIRNNSNPYDAARSQNLFMAHLVRSRTLLAAWQAGPPDRRRPLDQVRPKLGYLRPHSRLAPGSRISSRKAIGVTRSKGVRREKAALFQRAMCALEAHRLALDNQRWAIRPITVVDSSAPSAAPFSKSPSIRPS